MGDVEIELPRGLNHNDGELIICGKNATGQREAGKEGFDFGANRFPGVLFPKSVAREIVRMGAMSGLTQIIYKSLLPILAGDPFYA